ncbi:MAG: hypothetical protein AAFW73_12915 [Bacteroidota bacterium]
MPPLNAQDYRHVLENALCFIVVFALTVYGLGKWVQFDGATSIDRPVAELTGMELMWAFYGYSRPFVLLLGALEISAALLLLFAQTRLLGCLFASTILVNIILQDIFYGVNVGALRAALLYQSILLLLLYWHRERVLGALRRLLVPKPLPVHWRRSLVKLLLALGLFAVLRIGEYFLTVGI